MSDTAFATKPEETNKNPNFYSKPTPPVNPNWRQDYQKEFDDGNIKAPIWHRLKLLKPITDHYAHIKEHRGSLQIFFFKDVKNAEICVPTNCSPGKYLTQFYPELNSDQNKIRELQSIFDESYQLTIGETEEDFMEAYSAETITSCMDSRHTLPKPHPVKAYASGDWAIATLRKDGKITNRCIISKKSKTYFKEYPAGDARISAHLNLNGYKRATELKDTAGNRLKIMRVPGNLTTISVPYLDCDAKNVKIDGDYLVTCAQNAAGSIHTNASGKLNLLACSCCVSKTLYGSEYSVSSQNQVYPTYIPGRNNSVFVCDSCISTTSDKIYLCNYTDVYFVKETKFIENVPNMNMETILSNPKKAPFQRVNYDVFMTYHAKCSKTGAWLEKQFMDYDYENNQWSINPEKYNKTDRFFTKFIFDIVETSDKNVYQISK